MKNTISKSDTKDYIYVKGAKIHNLKNIDVAIPRNKLVVITGLSGSGKSSLAFNTLFAEGQRRYVESLSSYARQFLGRIDKPKVDSIKGISPAIAIEQKVNTSNPRSTVGTSTEIYDYLKILFARIGKTISPKSGKEVQKHTVKDVLNFIKKIPEGDRILLLAPIQIKKDRTLKKTLELLQLQGYSRIQYKEEVYKIDNPPKGLKKNFLLVVDRVVVKKDDQDYENRLADAIQTAFFEGDGSCLVYAISENKTTVFSNKFEADGISFLEPNTFFFSFNNPYGACPKCEGFGSIIGIDESLVIPNTSLSIYEDAIFPWRTSSFNSWKSKIIDHAYKHDIPIHKPWFQLTQKQQDLVWKGTKDFRGLHQFYDFLEQKSHKIQYRVMLSRYRGKTKCNQCNGSRLREEVKNVFVNNKHINQLIEMPISELALFFEKCTFSDYEIKIAKRLLTEITNRLHFLLNVGLGYLTLNRGSNTLSGGESQRINLATSLGSSLVGSMYILDEPSIGLHPKDTERLIAVLQDLKALGNTVIVVEHDEDIIKASDYIIDIGPEAGSNGGEVVATGNFSELIKSKSSLTAQYLTNQKEVIPPQKRSNFKNTIQIVGARAHNLKNIDVTIPLNCLTVVTGVSGSGKSTLVKSILYPALQKELAGYGEKPGEFTKMDGDIEKIKQLEFVSQNPIGKSSRSNPATYIKAFDDIRHLFASLPISKNRNYQAKHFSFNTEGGRCEICKGDGVVIVEMQFMADVTLQCESCKGKRFKEAVLEARFQDKSINDILNTTIDDAVALFSAHHKNKIVNKLKSLQDVGLGYVTLGQSSSTLSGGEAQRIKLASFLTKGSRQQPTLFIFDEPSTGLHFHDINKLIKSFEALLNNGHSIVVVEHNLDLIKCADYIIDLGKEGGEKGGNLIFQGSPEKMLKIKNSYTAKFLAAKTH